MDRDVMYLQVAAQIIFPFKHPQYRLWMKLFVKNQMGLQKKQIYKRVGNLKTAQRWSEGHFFFHKDHYLYCLERHDMHGITTFPTTRYSRSVSISVARTL
jgi:hypothetical protein